VLLKAQFSKASKRFKVQRVQHKARYKVPFSRVKRWLAKRSRPPKVQ
jgi:hypothetical protein